MTKPLYRRIVDDMLDEIQSGVLQAGARIPTEQELADRYGVSRITSARAVRELGTLGMVRRIRGSGSFVTGESEWDRNRARPNLVSLILPFSAQDEAGYALLRGLESQARAGRQLITIYNTEETPDKERRILEDVLEHQPRGIIIYPDTCLTNLEICGQLVTEGIPVVIIDREILGIDTRFVGSDNRAAMRLIVEYLISIGHRRIAYVANTRTTVLSEQARFLGYCDGLLRTGLPLREDYIVLFDESTAAEPIVQSPREDVGLALARQSLTQFMSHPEPPTAIVGVNDNKAVHLMKAALHKGLRVPKDVSVTGFDDLPIASHLEVPLTTMAQPFREIGVTAMRLLQEQITDPDASVRKVLLPTTLKVRSSTAPPAT